MNILEILLLVWAIIATILSVFFFCGMVELGKRYKAACDQLDVAADFVNGAKKKMILLGIVSALVLYLAAKKLDDASGE